MAILRETVVKVAKLASIELQEGDIVSLQQELSGIFSWIDQLAEVNTQQVPPLSSVCDTELPWREDKVTDGHKRDAVLANAPTQAYGCFMVPKVISDE